MTAGDDRGLNFGSPLTNTEQASGSAMRYCLDHIRKLDRLEDEGRSETIEARRRAIAGGAYHVSAAEVSRKLIEHMLESGDSSL